MIAHGELTHVYLNAVPDALAQVGKGTLDTPA